MIRHRIALPLALATLVTAAPLAAAPSSRPHVAWAANANIYEVNLRQFTPEGTINAFDKHLPRLQHMGVKIIWLMPIQPIGVQNRKGTLGSYYSIRDYTAVNPEFGTTADLRRMVAHAHKLGMKVILDWVANHTAWDHPWVTAHPDWYKTDETGKIVSVRFGTAPNFEEWTDVVALDYTKPGVADAMIAAMKHWVRVADIDGFRCDVAMLVPEPFWARARTELDAIKPMFMLAEADDPRLQQRAFDMTYHWTLHGLLVDIAKGRKTADDLRSFYARPEPGFAPDDWRMNFTSNHDKNSWDGSDTELFGAGFKAFAVLAATLPGMPLIYDGQESNLDKRLKFFEKDPIEWKDYPLAGFYRDLLALKRDNPALWNGTSGAPIEILPAGSPDVFAFRRTRGANRVTVVVNLSPRPQAVTIGGDGPRRLAPWGSWIDSRSPRAPGRSRVITQAGPAAAG